MSGPFAESHDDLRVDYLFRSQNHHQGDSRLRKRLPIPDLRFEQVYLSRIRSCLHIEPQLPAPTSEDGQYAEVTHVAPLITASQQVTSIDWRNLAYITFRDQVVIPLLQGMLWGVIGTYYRPFINLAKDKFRGKSPSPYPAEGEGVSWLRKWAKKLGFNSVVVGPSSVQGRT
ncbi:hypothetical protein F5J12DRAFT_926003 [Pisolithus orientalis]|uniref:Uncharacterized protein n=1 Tax=Pisolithus tinctorius Marx 270 TaxID=870435 RepID=A0A0C3PYI2_PISTI|nr:uncharacterized protein F5J12DRAFT_926003 [Pisolithus orientalis]KAI6019945.1 hypothetical protein F5J12DRAFT_926003 [Pisolithus orientalis]KAI6148663.1 hypothetical protein BKA82DRAFT_992531 [Pisolithus tinctorius]KIO14269.1 hypothetical protein M404DRAFT_992531 [Pisolithus tinctorius Marx 270]